MVDPSASSDPGPGRPPAHRPAGLAPSAPARSIARPGVEARLDAAAAHPLTLICAGPGWGKTTAVARWLASRPDTSARVAWVTVEPHAADAASFWEALLAALREVSGAPADHPLWALSASAGMSGETLDSVLSALASLTEEVLVVLDEFHRMSDPAVLRSVVELAERASPIRLVVITRIAAGLPRHRLRLAGELAELSADALAFDAAEVQQLAALHSLDLSASEAGALASRTEGWPAGVQLALLHASRHGPDALTDFAGSERSVAEYLLAEVLERNTPQVRDFLLRTSVTHAVCADLAAALVPGAPGQRILELLEERNEFVTALGPGRTWFSYHPLLRDMLEHALRRDDPQAHAEAHRRAAQWWATHGDPIEALGHAADAGDWPLLGRIYASAAAPSLVGARRDALVACLSRVPAERQDDDVHAALERAGLAFVEGRVGALRTHLDTARHRIELGDAADPPARVLLELLTTGAHRFSGDHASIAPAAAKALAILDAAEPFPAADNYRTVARHNLGVGHLWSGHLAEASSELRALLDTAQRPEPAGLDLLLLGARSNLALTEVARGRTAEAERIARVAIEDAIARGWTSLLHCRTAHLTLALVHLARGDWDDADTALTSGLAAIRDGEEPTTGLWLRCVQTELAVSRGHVRASHHAGRLLLASTRSWDPPDLLSNALEHALTDATLAALEAGAPVPRPERRTRADTPTLIACEARRRLAAGELARARDLIAAVLGLSQPETLLDLIAVVEAWLVTALVDARDGRTASALVAVHRAVELGEPAGLARPFLNTDPRRLLPLLREVARTEGPDGDFAQGLALRLGDQGEPAPKPDPLQEPLTGRELAMLRELPTLRSNSEIAEVTFVSVNTVKVHLKSLYRKLGVSSRREAVDRARELGLLQ